MGPTSAIHRDTLVVAFLSTDSVARAYEIDPFPDLDRKARA